MGAVEVLEPGLFTTVQDLGRKNFRRYGVPCSGALDGLAHAVANALVGNPAREATLEVSFVGPTLKFLSDSVVSLAGGTLAPKINGRLVSTNRSLVLRGGDVLETGPVDRGARCYIAFLGGIKVPRVLGSRSTHTGGNFGGYEGRRLQTGDRLRIGETSSPRARNGQANPLFRVAENKAPPLPFCEARPEEDTNRIRVVLDPRMDHETTAGFLRQDWQVSPQSDRAGYRLKGEPLHPAQSEIVSEPLNVGSIQILKDGQPALILADGPTIGGYPKVANVAMADLDRIAHIGPGGTIGFLAVDLDAATALYTAYARRWKRLKTYLEEV